MKNRRIARSWFRMALGGSLAFGGCQSSQGPLPAPPPPLGTYVDQAFEVQEQNAEASKLVVYQHEFELNDGAADPRSGVRLNSYGEDHVKQIAATLRGGISVPVVVERSQTSPRHGTEYQFPVHYNPELDLKRRQVVVNALQAMGIADAEERVLVAPAFAQGLDDSEAERAYSQGIHGGASGRPGGFGGGGFSSGGGFF